MIRQTKGYQILTGFRGQSLYDIESLIDYLLRLSQLVVDNPAIKELDLNPVMVLKDGKGVVIMDAKIIIGAQRIRLQSHKNIKNRLRAALLK